MHEYSRRDLVKGIAAGELETVTITTAGGRSVEGTLAVPDSVPAPAVLLIHEWWGLNDQIKSMAAEFAKEGYLALALDLFGGKVAKTSDEARQLTGGLDQSAGEDTVKAWGRWLKKHENGTGKLATVGWCSGGGWSLGSGPINFLFSIFADDDDPVQGGHH
ncbi:MAG: dienelactone hydrolase family protein, partial [Rhodospirillales bacterium]|nr:dienelactone hydrolase family protein [Rhodospirillales bacterium]